MGSVRDQVCDRVNEALVKAGVKTKVTLEHPELDAYGDFSANAILVLKGGRSKAEEVAGLIKPDDVIAKVEVAGAGFINIWVQNQRLIRELDRVIIAGQEYGSNEVFKGKRVIVEYSSPNIAKPFGIGHLSSTIIGQALYNLYKFSGAEVTGDNHVGDWGTQFGKLLFMIHKAGAGEDLTVEDMERMYVEFHKHPEWENEGRLWFKRLEEGDLEARTLWKRCVGVSMKEFERIYELLDVRIDNCYGESYYEELMKEVIKEAQSKGIAVQSEGAWVINVPGVEIPLMLLKSDGGTTYATRDLATIKFRKDKWDPDVVIYEVGAEQTLHFRQVFGAARMMGFVRDDTILIHTRHGLYLDKDGKKFATRKGKTVRLEDVLEEAISRAKALGCRDEETAKIVGIGAIKYFNLRHNVTSDVVFDWEKIMALEGNSGPYLQYTYARTRSVLERAEEEASGVRGYDGVNKEEIGVLRHIYRFGEVVEEAALRYAPNLVCNFLYELAQRYNAFYNQHLILSADSKEARSFRVALTAGVSQIIKNGLSLLGIGAPEKM